MNDIEYVSMLVDYNDVTAPSPRSSIIPYKSLLMRQPVYFRNVGYRRLAALTS